MTSEELLNHVKESHFEMYNELLNMYRDDTVICNWLTTPKPMLNNKSPIDLLDSEPEKIADFILKPKTGDLS